MRKIVCAAALLIAWSGAANAQQSVWPWWGATNPIPVTTANPLPVQGVGGGSAMKTDASNAVLPDARTNLDLTQFSPLSYGAKCDAETADTPTDNTVPLNSMFSDIRARQIAQTITAAFVEAGVGLCYHTGTINMTGLRDMPVIVDGLKLYSGTSGTPGIDALNSNNLRFNRLYMLPVIGSEPSYGIQIGLIASGGSGAGHITFDQPFLSGGFAKAAIYNFSSEIMTVISPFIYNSNTGSSYGMILDGCNHWNITSAFVTQTLPVDTCQSMNDIPVLGGEVSGHTPWWIGGVAGAQFIGGFSADTVGSGGNSAVLYQLSGGNGNTLMSFDNWHFEPSPADTFLVTGTAASPTLEGFTYRDLTSQATNSLFKLGGSATSVNLRDFDLHIANMAGGSKVFDDYTKWAISGSNVWVPAAADWAGTPTTFTGQVCSVDGGCTIYSAAPTASPGTNSTQIATTAFVQAGLSSGSGAVDHVSYQPGLLTAVNATKAAFHKFTKATTVDNIEGSAATFSCVANPTVTVYECGTSATCAASPVTIGTVTITAAGAVVDGTVSNAAITAGDYIAFGMSAGTCASVDLAVTVQTHVN